MRSRTSGRNAAEAIDVLAPGATEIVPRVRAARIAWLAVGAGALGALAIGAVAIGRLAIGSLHLRRGHVAKLRIDELEVGRLTLREPPPPL